MKPNLSIDQKIQHLAGTPLFKNLPLEALATIAAFANEKYFQPDEILVTEGDAGNNMFIIVEGNIRVSIKNSSGEDVELAVRGPGDHLGEMAILSEIPRTATLTTISQGLLLELTKVDFHSILSSNLQISLGIIRELIYRLDECDGRLRDKN